MRELAESHRASLSKLLKDAMLVCERRKLGGSVKQMWPYSVAPCLEGDGERADERAQQSRHGR
jgi:hypothetical protein